MGSIPAWDECRNTLNGNVIQTEIREVEQE